MGRDAEEQHLVDAHGAAGLDGLTDPVRGIAPLAVQRRDGLHEVLPLDDKEGVNQALGRDAGLPHHPAQRIRRPQPPGTNGKFHGKNTSFEDVKSFLPGGDQPRPYENIAGGSVGADCISARTRCVTFRAPAVPAAWTGRIYNAPLRRIRRRARQGRTYSPAPVSRISSTRDSMVASRATRTVRPWVRASRAVCSPMHRPST